MGWLWPPAGWRGGGPALPHPWGGFSRREQAARGNAAPQLRAEAKQCGSTQAPGLETLPQVDVVSQITPPARCAPPPPAEERLSTSGVRKRVKTPCLPVLGPSPGSRSPTGLTALHYFSDHSSCLGHALGPLFVAKDKPALSWHSSCRLVCEINELVDKLPLGSPAPKNTWAGGPLKPRAGLSLDSDAVGGDRHEGRPLA